MSRAEFDHLSVQQLYTVRKRLTNAQGYLTGFGDSTWNIEAARLGVTSETLYNAVLRQKVRKLRRAGRIS